MKIVKNKFVKAKTYKKRQLFAMMMVQMMQKKDIFEKYFKHDFLLLAVDRVINVRICAARTLRHHFLKEIAGEFVFDDACNDAVSVLK